MAKALIMKPTKRVPLGSLRRSRAWIWLVLLSIVSCTAMPPAKDYETPGALRNKLNGYVCTLNTVRPHLAALDEDFAALREQGGWVKRVMIPG